MKKNQELFGLIGETMAAFAPHYQEAMQAALAELEAQPMDWFRASLAYGVHPEPYTKAARQAIMPYNNPEQPLQFEETVEHGFVKEVADGSYELTKKGKQLLKQFYQQISEAIAPLEPMPASKIDKLASYLQRIIQATESTDKVTHTFFSFSRKSEGLFDNAAKLVYIDQYLTDLLRFRDDAHVAAWQPLGVTGQEWETLTFVWRGELTTAEAIGERLANRGYRVEQYGAALDALVARGWLTKSGDQYAVTAKGKKIRETAEAQTDDNFFIGWESLSAAEEEALVKLLTKLRDNLRDMAADKVVAERSDFWALAGATSGAIFAVTREAMAPVFQEEDLMERGLPFALLQALTFDPEAISSAAMRQRFPYAAPNNFTPLFERLTEKAYLSANGEGFHITDKARAFGKKTMGAFDARLRAVSEAIRDEMPAEEIEKVADFLKRIIDSALQGNTPAGALCLQRSVNGHIDDMAPLTQIDQYLDDLNAYRDDAHLATFKDHHIEGHAWELFTNIWRGNVDDIPSFADKMAFRGHSKEAYQKVLVDLAERGWVDTSGDKLQLTDAGKKVREQSETLTDRYFYAPWTVLNQAETEELRHLLTKLKSSLEALAEREKAEAATA